MEGILVSLGLGYLLENFNINKVGVAEVRQLSDENFINLGVVTIGDRIRLKDAVSKHYQDPAASNTTNPVSSPVSSHSAASVATALFRPSRSRFNTRPQKKGKKNTWTGTFLCMADKNATKVPNSTAKTILQKAGLGVKRIQFCLDDKPETVVANIKLEYPKLERAGGFELLRCEANCRTLNMIECEWSASSLRACVGSQAKIYIRPIQSNVSVETNNNDVVDEVKEPCVHCGLSIFLKDLRSHSQSCRDSELLIQQHQNPPEVHVENNSVHQQQQFDTPTTQRTQLIQQHQNPPEVHVENNSVHQQQQFDTPTTQRTQLIQQHQNPPEVHVENNSVHQQQQFDTPTTQHTQQLQHEETENMQYVLGNHYVQEDIDIVNYVIDNEQTDMETVTKTCINEINEKNIQDPIHMLRFIQKKIVTGRKLDIDEEDIATGNPITGDTNFIVVDRNRIIESTFENIPGIFNLRHTLEVQFCEETAEDYGGPRKEFFSLVLPQIYEKYFDPLKEYLEEDYETVGKIFALSMLQNGKLPRIFTEDMLKELTGPNPTGAILYLKRGMDSLGLIEIAHAHPMFLHLLTPEHRPPLSLKMLTNLLKPQFSVLGSNKRVLESVVYQKFIKYTREVSAGRRQDLTLGKILSFVTAVDEEPALGFTLSPSIEFAERLSYLPTSNTCINKLILTLPNDLSDMPEDQFLFEKFDYAFCNSYFGLA